MIVGLVLVGAAVTTICAWFLLTAILTIAEGAL